MPKPGKRSTDDDNTSKNDKVSCSFCYKRQDQVRHLVASPPRRSDRVYICDECIAVCNSILEHLEDQNTKELPK